MHFHRLHRPTLHDPDEIARSISARHPQREVSVIPRPATAPANCASFTAVTSWPSTRIDWL